MGGQQTPQLILDALRTALESTGFDLEDVEISTPGRRRLLRVLIDKDGGLTVDDIAIAARLVDQRLDESGVMGESSYTLEVTSPGVDRPLTLPRHWRRNVGRLVRVSTVNGTAVTGRVVGCDDTAVRLAQEPTPRTVGRAREDGPVIEIAYGDVANARVQIEFNPPRSRGGAIAPPDDSVFSSASPAGQGLE